MENLHHVIAILLGIMAFSLCACAAGPKHGAAAIPDVPREFRGAWVATVANIDWPSRPGLPTDAQQAELIAIFEKAVQLNLNAIVLQIRPAGDAFYESPLEPWSQHLTGEQGRAPEPFYDPVAFATHEAHRRGLELHAWFNPYRVGHPSRQGDFASSHITQTRPHLVHAYGPMHWLDPGERQVQEHSLAVILDVVNRYDIDGVHLDDYFYPYPRKDDAGNEIPFPDQASYQRYRDHGGQLERADWRRRNVDQFIKRLYKQVKAAKPHVKVGISPFGIWKPGHPAPIKGMNQYERIYADARKWLRRGWCDYFTPQLYWRIANPDQSFVALLEWWKKQNRHDRHLWPGLFTSRTQDGSTKAFDENEIRYQIAWSRLLLTEDPGNVQFSFKALLNNVAGVADTLRKELYAEPALVPASPWLGKRRPKAPKATIADVNRSHVAIGIAPAKSAADCRVMVVQIQHADQWQIKLYPADVRWIELNQDVKNIKRIAIRTVSRTGAMSDPCHLLIPQ